MNPAVIQNVIPSGFMFKGILIGLLAFYLIVKFRDKKMKDYRGA